MNKMDRIQTIEIGRKEYPMIMSLTATEQINKKYGSIEKMLDKMASIEDREETFAEVLELMIRQGCEYKNVFEADIPHDQNAPIVDGKYTPIEKEKIMLGIERRRIGEITKKICYTAGLALKNEIAGKDTSKKNETAT